mgnify:CR=1 FL=1|jgi:hypothetical protein
MKKINTATEILLEMDLAFKAAGVEFLNSEKVLVLEYLYKTKAEDKDNSTLKRFKSISFDISKYFLG